MTDVVRIGEMGLTIPITRTYRQRLSHVFAYISFLLYLPFFAVIYLDLPRPGDSQHGTVFGHDSLFVI